MKEQLQVRSRRLREFWVGPGGGENKKAGTAGGGQNTEARAHTEKDPGPKAEGGFINHTQWLRRLCDTASAS